MTWTGNRRADPYSEWTSEVLREALREAETLYDLLGALDQKRMNSNVRALKLRELSDQERQMLRERTADTLAELRFALRRRGGR